MGKIYETNSSFHVKWQIFQQFSPSIKKILSLEGRLGTRSLIYEVLRFS